MTELTIIGQVGLTLVMLGISLVVIGINRHDIRPSKTHWHFDAVNEDGRTGIKANDSFLEWEVIDRLRKQATK